MFAKENQSLCKKLPLQYESISVDLNFDSRCIYIQTESSVAKSERLKSRYFYILATVVIAALCVLALSNFYSFRKYSDYKNALENGIYSNRDYDRLDINVSLVLSAQAYCHIPDRNREKDDDSYAYYYDDDDHNSYLSMTYKSHANGFIPTSVLFDGSTETNGFVGIMPELSVIYVVYRGSADIENWIENLNYEFTDFSSPNCSGCKVHDGFYSAAKSVEDAMHSEVSRLLMIYPSYSVIVTGHSLGAACATFGALSLIINNITNATLINFGSPRTGNPNFAEYASNLISNRRRVTHRRDTVPHVPSTFQGFMHISGERYQPEWNIDLRKCTGYEDSQCSDRWWLTNIEDHLNYLGTYMSCSLNPP